MLFVQKFILIIGYYLRVDKGTSNEGASHLIASTLDIFNHIRN